jgi:hypothetical protein
MYLNLLIVALAFGLVTHTSALTLDQRQTESISPKCCLPPNYVCDPAPVVGIPARIGCCSSYRCIGASSRVGVVRFHLNEFEVTCDAVKYKCLLLSAE